MKFRVKYILLTTVLFVSNCMYSHTRNDIENNDSIAVNHKLNVSVEALGMLSLVFQKEPYPYVQATPATTGNYLAGYIPTSRFSSQFGVLSTFNLYKSFFIKSGLQFKFLNSKYDRIIDFAAPNEINPEVIYGKSYFMTMTNYIMYKKGSNFFGAGFSLFAYSARRINFQPESWNRYSAINYRYLPCLFRYERNIKKLGNYSINILTELEGQLRRKTNSYFQLKIGLSLNFN